MKIVEDKRKAVEILEGQLVYIVAKDDYEMLDYYTMNSDGSVMLGFNQCSVKIKDMISIKKIEDKAVYEKDSFNCFIPSKYEH